MFLDAATAEIAAASGITPPTASELIAMGNVNVLPDSRSSTVFTPKKAVMGPMGWMVPIFCPSCGVEGGHVPQENMTFAFWLCAKCFEKYGELTNMFVLPDEVFFEAIKQEQMEKYGRLLEQHELVAVVEADASPLATLIKQGSTTPSSLGG